MIKRRKTEITVESRELFVIASAVASNEAWCRECAEPARLFSPEQAAVYMGVSTRSIYRMVEAGEFHYTETVDAGLLICLNSSVTGFTKKF